MIKHECEQGSVDWALIRAGKVTASGFDNIVTPLFKARSGEMVESYLATLVAESWQGCALDNFSSFPTEQGIILERDAPNWLDLQFGMTVEKVGFITDDGNRYGASPDGIIGDVGLEIKCLQPVAHIKQLLRNAVPPEYLPQIHFSMFVTGFKRWHYLGYSRHFPKLFLTVERDEEIQEAIGAALEAFLVRFDAAMARLTEINGGPPRRLTPMPEKKRERQGQPHFVSQIPS